MTSIVGSLSGGCPGGAPDIDGRKTAGKRPGAERGGSLPDRRVFAIRSLTRRPGAATAAILSLALGIAANATISAWSTRSSSPP